MPSLQRQLRQRPAGAELGCLSERLVIPSERSESRNRGCVPLFTPGKPDRGQGLERLAEDGNPGVLADYVSANMKSVVDSGIVTVPSGDKGPGPITPGKAFEFVVSAAPGQRLVAMPLLVT